MAKCCWKMTLKALKIGAGEVRSNEMYRKLMLSLKPTLPELDKGPKNNLLQSVEVVKLQRQVFLAD